MVERSSADKFYVWFDTEYTNQELDRAVILQVAALITDKFLCRVLPQNHDVRLTIKLPEGTTLSPWVEQNLSDLLKECRSSRSIDIEEADKRLAAYVDTVAGSPSSREDQRPVLAGNSIHADWWLVRRFLPNFLSRLHYRHLDVTAFKLEWKNLYGNREFEKEKPENISKYFPEAVLSASDNRHDAYYDLQASIAELAFYRRYLFINHKQS